MRAQIVHGVAILAMSGDHTVFVLSMLRRWLSKRRRGVLQEGEQRS